MDLRELATDTCPRHGCERTEPCAAAGTGNCALATSSSGPFKLLVCGSRDWEDRATIKDALDGLALKYGPLHVIHGDCRGPDQVAARRAEFLGFTVTAFPADWETHGKAAGPIRNLQMLDEKPDGVLAFQRNGSRGTQHTIDEARRRGIPVEVVIARDALEGK